MSTPTSMHDLKQLWDNTLAEMELTVSKANFATWFKHTYILKEEEGVVYVAVPSSFVKTWLQDKYDKFILKTLRNSSDHVRNIELIVVPRDKKVEHEQVEEKKEVYAHELPLKDLYINKDDNLNPRYTFDSFVVGTFNELANAAAQAILKGPGITYNPLFIYGATGLGKTHLIQAIGNKIKKDFPQMKVYYITSEKFFLDYVNSVQNNKAHVFKERYRKYDFFLMDDVQILSGKNSTQEELFHLFNFLYDNNKQIVFSSDKHYNHIPNIEDRLKTRMGAGMMIDIGEPDFESRIAILRSKLKSMNFSPDRETLEYIANSVQSSIREMEGILNTIICQAQVKNRDLTINEVKAIIKNNERPKKSVSVDEVIKIVADFYDIEKNSIYEKTRRKEIVRPRQIVMYLLREDFNISYPSIGSKLGGRDHTTVIHSCDKVKNDLKENSMFAQELDQIRSML